MSEESLENVDKPQYTDPETGKFVVGNPGGGRPKDTEEQKLAKQVIKKLVEEYKEVLASTLPKIGPVITAKALRGDIMAIKEIHDRVMGKPEQKTDVEISVNPKPIYGGLSRYNSDQEDIQPEEENQSS